MYLLFNRWKIFPSRLTKHINKLVHLHRLLTWYAILSESIFPILNQRLINLYIMKSLRSPIKQIFSLVRCCKPKMCTQMESVSGLRCGPKTPISGEQIHVIRKHCLRFRYYPLVRWMRFLGLYWRSMADYFSYLWY